MGVGVSSLGVNMTAWSSLAYVANGALPVSTSFDAVGEEQVSLASQTTLRSFSGKSASPLSESSSTSNPDEMEQHKGEKGNPR